MWTRFDLTKPIRLPIHPASLPSRMLLVLLLLAGSMLSDLSAQEASTASTASAPELEAAHLAALSDALAADFQLLPLAEGVALMPRSAAVGDFRLIEISAAGVAVDGRRQTPDELQALLGDRAEPVLRLAGLSVAERAQVAALPRSTTPPPVAEPPAIGENNQTAEGTPEAEETEESASVPEDSPEPPQARPSRPASDSSRGRVSFGDRVVVKEGETVEEAVAFGGELIIQGEVEGDAIAFGDDVEVSGTVHGTATAVGGDVKLKPGAEVFGDAVSVGGEVHRDPDATVHGREREVWVDLGAWPDWPNWDNWPNWDRWDRWRWPGSHWRNPFGSFFGMLWDVGGGVLHIVLLSLLCCLILLVAPRRVEQAATAVRREPWKAGLIGLASFLLFWTFVVLLTLLLVASCLGVVLLPVVALLVLAFIIVCLVGYTAAAYRLGHFLQDRFGIRFGSPYIATIAGVVAIQVWAVIAGTLGWGGWPLFLLAVMFLFFGFLVELWAWMVGLGGFLMSRSEASGAAPNPEPIDPLVLES